MTPLLRLPEFLDTTLGNGLRVLVAEDHQQPAAFFRLLVKVGERAEPEGREGLAELTAQLLDQGTATRSAEEIAEAIDSIGAKLEALASAEYTTMSCDLLSKDTALGLELLSEIVRSPIFPARDLGRLKRQLVAELKQLRSEPSTLARSHAFNLLFGSNDRLGREKTEQSIGRIQVKDVQAFYQRFFHPDDAILLAIGDFNRTEMLDQLKARFEDWPAKRDSPETLTTKTPRYQDDSRCSEAQADAKSGTTAKIGDSPQAGTVPIFARDSPQFRTEFRFVNKPDLTQGTIVIAEKGIEERNPDRLAYQLMDYILVGGGFSSRLYSVIRAKEGKTYHVGSLRTHFADCGVWGLWTFTQNQEIADTYERLQAELRKFIEDGVTEEELKKAKSFYLGAIPLSLESPAAVAGRVLDDLYHGITIEEQRQELVRLNAVTREDVNRVARTHLSGDTFKLVIVGNQAKVKDELNRIGRYESRDWRAPIAR